MKRKQSPCKPGPVPLAGCLSFIYSAGYPTALAFYPPSYPERFGRTALNRWYTRTCSLQMEQPDDHPPAGGLLHHLLTLTPWGGYFLLPDPAVTNCWHFHQWSVLCCPDFPLVPLWTPATDRGSAFSVQNYKKITKNNYAVANFSFFTFHFSLYFVPLQPFL